MNKQKPGGIEWTMIRNPDGSIRPGYTWNPIGGCCHDCAWIMPDGQVAECYAGAVAERLASAAYPHGFKHHYWRPEKLEEPLKVGKPAGIFTGSMADMFAADVSRGHVKQVLDTMWAAEWHTFFALTKHAPGLLKYRGLLPKNLWIGISSPPDRMYGKWLTDDQKRKMFLRGCNILEEFQAAGHITFWSMEPLTFDPMPALNCTSYNPDWIIEGAASNGAKKYQPDPALLSQIEGYADTYEIPVFHKNNLKVDGPRRMEFPCWL